jgi:hypothetical protein
VGADSQVDAQNLSLNQAKQGKPSFATSRLFQAKIVDG